jgi:hypothetical protein
MNKIKYVILNFENLENLRLNNFYVKQLYINDVVGISYMHKDEYVRNEKIAKSIYITLDNRILDIPVLSFGLKTVKERIEYNDISSIDIVFDKDGLEIEDSFRVDWEDDPKDESRNLNQINEFTDEGIFITIK